MQLKGLKLLHHTVAMPTCKEVDSLTDLFNKSTTGQICCIRCIDLLLKQIIDVFIICVIILGWSKCVLLKHLMENFPPVPYIAVILYVFLSSTHSVYCICTGVSVWKSTRISVDRGKPSQAACAQTMGLICSYESYDFSPSIPREGKMSWKQEVSGPAWHPLAGNVWKWCQLSNTGNQWDLMRTVLFDDFVVKG